MNEPFVSFQYRVVKVLCVLYLQTNSGFLKLRIGIIFFMRIFACFTSQIITKLVFGPPDPLWPYVVPGLGNYTKLKKTGAKKQY